MYMAGSITITGSTIVSTDKGDILFVTANETTTISAFSRVSVICDDALRFNLLSAIVNSLVDFHTDIESGTVYLNTTPNLNITGFAGYTIGTSGVSAIKMFLANGVAAGSFSFVSGTNPYFSIPIILKRLDNTYVAICIYYEITNAYQVGLVGAYCSIYAPTYAGTDTIPGISIIQPEFFSEWEDAGYGGTCYVIIYNSGFSDYFSGLSPYIPDTDPYLPGGTTDEGGGTGTFDDTSDPIPVPDLPTVTVTDTGFISLYTPTLAQLKSLATYLWDSNGLDLDTFKRIFSDPISAILGLSLVPINPGAGTSASVILGNIDTGVTMPRVQNQFIRFSCGSLTIEEYWGGYLDYSPYTRAEIYLPFIGAKPLNVDDIMGKTVTLWYLFDILSGGCVACLECNGSILYQFMGECACSIPITGRDLTNVINGLLTVVGAGVGAMVATGGAMAAAGGATLAGVAGAGAAAAAGSLARNVTGMKTYVEKSGSMGGMGGMLGVKTPYIILTRPRQALPANQNTYTGYPSYITTLLGDCSGFTVVQDVHLEGLTATEEEKAEIGRLLREGVYL